MKKKKCKCKEKPEIWFGVYYHQGEIEEADERMILKALKHGAKVYHQYGKPVEPCGVLGFPPCK